VDAAFVRATKFIRGRDAVEEFVACGMHPLAVVVGFNKVATLMTLALRLRVPLPKYDAVYKEDEDLFKRPLLFTMQASCSRRV
jgi:hypothetical protein